ncbi:hypothetical protein AHAS_Ahas02G0234000 [Arachis hypogaea]
MRRGAVACHDGLQLPWRKEIQRLPTSLHPPPSSAAAVVFPSLLIFVAVAFTSCSHPPVAILFQFRPSRVFLSFRPSRSSTVVLAFQFLLTSTRGHGDEGGSVGSSRRFAAALLHKHDEAIFELPLHSASTGGGAASSAYGGTQHQPLRLSKRTTSEKLRDEFAKFGEVVHARVVTDRVSGYSKGFGFVKYATLEDAAKGIEGMDGKFLDGWVIFAEYARPRPPPGQPENNMPPQYGRQ